MKLRIKDTPLTLKVIGIYQLIGGLLGLALIGWLLINTGQLNGPLIFIFIIAVGLYSFSIKAGLTLLNKKKTKRGIIYSLINHAFQLIGFSLGSFQYEFFSGLKLTLGINFTDNFEFVSAAGVSEFNFQFNNGASEYMFYLNIFAIFVSYILVDIYDETFNME